MADVAQATDSADGGASEQPGNDIGVVVSKETPSGKASTDELARIRQEALNIGYGKAMAKVEKEWTSREAKLRGQVLQELGFSSDDDVAKFKESRQAEEKKQPEHERKYREADRQLRELQSKFDESQKTRDVLAERWFSEFKGRLSSGIARQVDLHAEAEDDLDAFLDRSIVTPDGDSGDKLVFRDRDVEIDMSDREATKKIAAHVQKYKPLWIRPTLGHGAGTSQPRPSNGNGKKLSPAELRQAFIEETVASMPMIKR